MIYKTYFDEKTEQEKELATSWRGDCFFEALHEAAFQSGVVKVRDDEGREVKNLRGDWYTGSKDTADEARREGYQVEYDDLLGMYEIKVYAKKLAPADRT
jgi:hypothetical protein